MGGDLFAGAGDHVDEPQGGAVLRGDAGTVPTRWGAPDGGRATTGRGPQP